MLRSGTARILGTIIIGCLSTVVIAQNADTPANSRGRTSAEILRDYGIDPSESSLLAALKNANPRVRMLAAFQLQSDRDNDAIPAIERALSDEKDPMMRAEIATALGALDHSGIEHLQAMCADAALPIRALTYAVQMLQLLNESSAGCLDRVLGSLNRADERDYLDTTVTLLPPIYSEVSRDQADWILSSIQKLLNDRSQQPSVRLAAGQALAEIGAPSSIDIVRGALSREDDPVMRSRLQEDLTALEKKQ